ncbi:MAG TPA: hypothetical protein VK211_15715 [Kamptonema sp.]|nr:hypothetical protein [Kamptonema sp.]
MSEKEQVEFKINKKLFDQLAEWQEKMEEADRLADDSHEEERPKIERYPDIYEQHSKTDNS